MRKFKSFIGAVCGVLSFCSCFGQYFDPNNPLASAQQLMGSNNPSSLNYIGTAWTTIAGQGYTNVSMYFDGETGEVYWENPLDSNFDTYYYDDSAYAAEQAEWDSFIAANDAAVAQQIAADNAAAWDKANAIVASGRPVQVNYSDGTSTVFLPNRESMTFDNPNHIPVVVPVYADGYKFDGIGLSQSAVNILNDPSRKITSYAQAESQASIDATFSQTAHSVADANNALFDIWLKRDMMASGSFGDPSAFEGYIGAGAFGHSFDGWLDLDDETGAWKTSELINMFLAELPYQVPVFNIGYKVGTAVLPYTYFVPYEDYGSTAQDPFTGNPLSSGGLLLEAGIDAGALIVTYRIIPPAYSFGSYADDLVLAELRVLRAERIPTHLTSHPNAHTISRHGGAITDEQLMQRAWTGVAPDGSGGAHVPPLSTAFYSDELMLQADTFIRGGALQAKIAANPGVNVLTLRSIDVGDIGVSLGRGFKRVGSSSNLNALGPLMKLDDIRSVRATLEKNASGAWETITMFPEPL